MKVVVVIPTYNEKENIEQLIRETLNVCARHKDKYLILVVDDNSPDGTGDIVKGFSKTHRNVILLSGKKEGLGNAMIRAYKYAVRKLGADVVVTTEADFAYHPKYIPYAVGKIKEGHSVVVASRHVGKGRTKGWTTNRKINHWIANKLFATWVAGVSEVYDHNGAFRAVRVKNVLEKVSFDKLGVSGFGFFNYSLFKLTQITSKFHEFPVVYKFRTRGESKVSFNPKYFFTYLHDVIEYITLCLRIRAEKLLK